MNKPGDLVIKKHGDADEIWLLRRQKVKSGKAKLLDVLVCFFTPLAEITETADTIADMGYYYLVIKNGQPILARCEKGELTEKAITRLSDGKKFTVDQNIFVKVRKIHG
ncbi:MAG: hypothetical protein E7546_07880 [Ruminococcaceae bacterium]|nr:hypothetical protein [Oscillospiraceae bacterium]